MPRKSKYIKRIDDGWEVRIERRGKPAFHQVILDKMFQGKSNLSREYAEKLKETELAALRANGRLID